MTKVLVTEREGKNFARAIRAQGSIVRRVQSGALQKIITQRAWVVERHFQEDAAQMCADGLKGHAQRVGDFYVAKTERGEIRDLAFAGGQIIVGNFLRGGL